MIDRFKAHFFPEMSKSVDYTDINISDRARKTLESNIDNQTLTQVMSVFRPLPQAYRSPEVLIDRIAQEPLLKVQKGLVMYKDYVAGITDYIIPFGFRPEERNAGECGDIAKWFLYDLRKEGLVDRLNQQRIFIGLTRGLAPQFFNTDGSTHIWITLRNKNKSGVIIDPAFGNIVAEEENSGYKSKNVNDFLLEQKNGLFEDKNHRIYGWEDRLIVGGNCDQSGKPYAPSSKVIGLSQYGDHDFGLGISTVDDRPFISVGYPYGDDQELYWAESLEGNSYQVGFMSSHNRSLAVEKPEVMFEVQSLLHKANNISFEEPGLNDPRLKGMFFG